MRPHRQAHDAATAESITRSDPVERPTVPPETEPPVRRGSRGGWGRPTARPSPADLLWCRRGVARRLASCRQPCELTRRLDARPEPRRDRGRRRLPSTPAARAAQVGAGPAWFRPPGWEPDPHSMLRGRNPQPGASYPPSLRTDVPPCILRRCRAPRWLRDPLVPLCTTPEDRHRRSSTLRTMPGSQGERPATTRSSRSRTAVMASRSRRGASGRVGRS